MKEDFWTNFGFGGMMKLNDTYDLDYKVPRAH